MFVVYCKILKTSLLYMLKRIIPRASPCFTPTLLMKSEPLYIKPLLAIIKPLVVVLYIDFINCKKRPLMSKMSKMSKIHFYFDCRDVPFDLLFALHVVSFYISKVFCAIWFIICSSCSLLLYFKSVLCHLIYYLLFM